MQNSAKLPVYIHCIFYVCFVTDQSSRCEPDCSGSFRRKRAAYAGSNYANSEITQTIGPFYGKYSNFTRVFILTQQRCTLFVRDTFLKKLVDVTVYEYLKLDIFYTVCSNVSLLTVVICDFCSRQRKKSKKGVAK